MGSVTKYEPLKSISHFNVFPEGERKNDNKNSIIRECHYRSGGGGGVVSVFFFYISDIFPLQP